MTIGFVIIKKMRSEKIESVAHTNLINHMSILAKDYLFYTQKNKLTNLFVTKHNEFLA